MGAEDTAWHLSDSGLESAWRHGVRLRRLLRVPSSRNPKALGLCLSAYCDLARAGYDVAAQAQWLKGELQRLRSPGESDYCWGYDWDYLSLRGSRLPAFSANAVASYFCATALLEMNEVFGDLEAGEMAASTAHFFATRLHRSFEDDDALCLSYTPDSAYPHLQQQRAGWGSARAHRPGAGQRGICRVGAQDDGFSHTMPVAGRRVVLRKAATATLDR